MPKFKCCVCEVEFEVVQAALDKYPGWQPKYCRKHSPKKKNSNGAKSSQLDLTLTEVLEKYSAGPDTGVFTDGGARPNPGPGGWGVVHVEAGEIIQQLHGKDPDTTNNRMELRALIEAYKLLPVDSTLTVYSDSDLCVKTINQWAKNWEQKGWKKKNGPIKNLELIQELYALAQAHPTIKLEWIKAHNGWLWNEYVDALASAWARDEL